MVAITRFYIGSYRECRSGGNNLSTVRSFIVLLSGEGLACYSINTERTEKEKIRTRAKTLS